MSYFAIHTGYIHIIWHFHVKKQKNQINQMLIKEGYSYSQELSI